MRLETAREILEPYHNRILNCIETGWKQWVDEIKKNPAKAQAASPRTRASAVNDYIVAEVKKRFSGEENITLSEVYKFFFLIVETPAFAIGIRFKKLDQNGRTCNIRTRNQKEIFGEQKELPGLPRGIWITAGYQLNTLRTDIMSVQLVYERNDKRIWSYTLKGTNENIEALPLPIDVETNPKRKVKAKNQILDSNTGSDGTKS